MRATLARLLVWLLVLPEVAVAFAQLPRPGTCSSRAAGCTQQARAQAARFAVPQAGLATEDLVPVIAAVVLTAAAGLLQAKKEDEEKIETLGSWVTFVTKWLPGRTKEGIAIKQGDFEDKVLMAEKVRSVVFGEKYDTAEKRG